MCREKILIARTFVCEFAFLSLVDLFFCFMIYFSFVIYFLDATVELGRSLYYALLHVGAESDQQVNIYSFAVRCDRRWPST